MALTKAKIAALVSELKHGGDAPSKPKFHPTIIYTVAEIVRNQIIEMAYYKSRAEGDGSVPGEFYKAFSNLPVKHCGLTDREYIDLPSRIVSLPHNRGLLSVGAMKDISNPFHIVDAGSDAIYSVLDVEYFGDPEAYIESNRIYLRYLPNGVKDILVRMIPAIDDLKSDDIVPMPATMEADFIRMVSEMLEEQKVTPQDNYNDSNAS